MCEYEVAEQLGGLKGFSHARKELANRGLRLILDFVPNHVAPDHPWVTKHPEHFIQGTTEDAVIDPASYIELNGTVFACGKDPYFPAWPDVLQLNAFHPGLRQAVAVTFSKIASQCDGVRCDMAMLLMNTIFERTWGNRAGSRPATNIGLTLFPPSNENIQSFSSSPRPTGTWNGSCNSRDSTFVTTSDFTIV